MFGGGNGQRLSVFEDRVEVSTHNFVSEDVERVRYDRIAGVARRSGLFFSVISVETKGGAVFAVKGLANDKATVAVELIEARLA